MTGLRLGGSRLAAWTGKAVRIGAIVAHEQIPFVFNRFGNEFRVRALSSLVGDGFGRALDYRSVVDSNERFVLALRGLSTKSRSGGRPGYHKRRPGAGRTKPNNLFNNVFVAQNTETGRNWDNQVESADGMIRLVDQHGVNRGIVSLDFALKTAKADKLNVLQVTDLNLDKEKAASLPPVCKIVNMDQFKYKKKKREQQVAQQARLSKKQHTVKELKFGTSIGENDMMFKVRKCEEFLKKLHPVRVTILFRRSKKIKPSEREGKAFEILRIAGEYLEPYGRELVEQRKVMLGSVRSVFVPSTGTKGKIKPSDSLKQDKAMEALRASAREDAQYSDDDDDSEEDLEDDSQEEEEPEIHSVNPQKKLKKTELLKRA